MKKDIDFYNKASGSYSDKRYLGDADNFIKFFFKRRLGLFLGFLRTELATNFFGRKISLLDIGCADGFVMAQAYAISPKSIERAVGIDTSPDMINQARKSFSSARPFDFFVRGTEAPKQYDVIVELGVPISDWKSEFTFVSSRLTDDGVYIFSTPGSKNSLYSRLKGEFHIDNPLSFREFDSLIAEFFEVKESKVYAFFVPKLWTAPSVARFFSPIIEGVFSLILPSLFHEKMYVLRKKSSKASHG